VFSGDLLVQPNPVNRITNLSDILCAFNRNMQLSASDKYAQVYCLTAQGGQKSVLSPIINAFEA